MYVVYFFILFSTYTCDQPMLANHACLRARQCVLCVYVKKLHVVL